MKFILSIPLLPTATATVSPCLILKPEETGKTEASTAPEISVKGKLDSFCDTNAVSEYLIAFAGTISFLITMETNRMENQEKRHKPL
jgi:hypothetical protein